jgi:hypothetical protein
MRLFSVLPAKSRNAVFVEVSVAFHPWGWRCDGLKLPILFGTLLPWQILSFGTGEIFELFFAHRFSHLFGSAFERRLSYFSALGGKGCSGGHLLFL